MWLALMQLIGGPVVSGLIGAYKEHLKAQTQDATIAANLAAKEIAAQTLETQAIAQIRIAEIGHPWEVDKLFAYVTLVYFAKLIIWDKVMGSFLGYTHNIFETDPLTSYDAIWGGMIITYYFGKRGFENVARILKR